MREVAEEAESRVLCWEVREGGAEGLSGVLLAILPTSSSSLKKLFLTPVWPAERCVIISGGLFMLSLSPYRRRKSLSSSESSLSGNEACDTATGDVMGGCRSRGPWLPIILLVWIGKGVAAWFGLYLASSSSSSTGKILLDGGACDALCEDSGKALLFMTLYAWDFWLGFLNVLCWVGLC